MSVCVAERYGKYLTSQKMIYFLKIYSPLQVLFFLLAEKLLCPDQYLACLYCLLFYTVLAYLQRSLYVRMAQKTGRVKQICFSFFKEKIILGIQTHVVLLQRRGTFLNTESHINAMQVGLMIKMITQK